MIDMHTHVLPQIDDGAKDLETAKTLLLLEEAQGVSEIVFTPHYYGQKRSLQQFLDQRDKALQELAPHILPTLKCRVGAEVHITGVNDPSDENLCMLAIGGTRYVLMELPFTGRWNKSLFSRIESFIADTEYFPIIAHAERYERFRKKPSLINELVKKGCLIQLNGHAFLRKRTQRFAFALLKRGLVHCLGTDTHDTENRAPDYTAVKAAIVNAGYQKAWDTIQTNMRRVLNGEVIRVGYTPLHKFLRWYF
jgi:protein-tyrosine phosphatase